MFWITLAWQLVLWHLGLVKCVNPCPPSWFAELYLEIFGVWPWCCEVILALLR